jgi:hypothetical protein
MKNLEDLKKQLGLTNGQMYRIALLYVRGNSVENISKNTGIDKDRIREFIKARDREPIEIERKNEPAPAATGTSSSVDNDIQNETTEKEQPCAPSLPSHYIIAAEKSQALKALEEAREGLLEIYNCMEENEQRAFDIGEIYGKIDAAITREEGQE